MDDLTRRSVMSLAAGTAAALVIGSAGENVEAAEGQPDTYTKNNIEEIGKFANAVKNATFRTKFVTNPEEALKGAGLNERDLPETFLASIKSLSLDELDAMSAINAKAAASGLTNARGFTSNGYIYF